MKYLCIGKLVNTHGILGEVRILSDFEFKDRVFSIGNEIMVGERKDSLIIKSYRKHKNFDMLTFENITNIQNVLKYKGKYVYVLKDSITLLENEILDDDLIGMECFFSNNKIGNVLEIINNNGYKIIRTTTALIPYNKDFIETIDKNNKIIIFKNIGGLLNEN